MTEILTVALIVLTATGFLLFLVGAAVNLSATPDGLFYRASIAAVTAGATILLTVICVVVVIGSAELIQDVLR